MALNNVENVSPHIIRQVSKELMELQKDPPEGVKIQINDHDVTDINATFEGPDGTPYSGGLFQVKLVLGKNFPADPPKGFFLTKIFHPNVANNGEICVNTLKKDWQSSYGIKHILLTIKCLLIVPNPESALNEEAGRLLLEHYNDYFARARLFTDIHAKSRSVSNNSGNQSVVNGAGSNNGSGLSNDRKKIAPFQPVLDKKKILKRL